MNGANPVVDQSKGRNALTLLFMSLEDAHEPRGRLLTGGCRLVRDASPPQGLEEDLNEFAQDLAFTASRSPTAPSTSGTVCGAALSGFSTSA